MRNIYSCVSVTKLYRKITICWCQSNQHQKKVSWKQRRLIPGVSAKQDGFVAADIALILPSGNWFLKRHDPFCLKGYLLELVSPLLSTDSGCRQAELQEYPRNLLPGKMSTNSTLLLTGPVSPFRHVLLNPKSRCAASFPDDSFRWCQQNSFSSSGNTHF